jgi:hypothetical protein
MACDGGGDNNGDGGNNNDPFVSVCDGFIVTITGTEGDDNLVGTEGNDVIRGLGGNDTIDGRGGNDRICGDRGNDNLLGGNGNDILDGGPDDDIVDGESGDDIIIEAPGSHDVLVGPAFDPQGPQNLDEVSYTDAISGIFMNITSNENQVVDEDGNTVRLDGFFPNIYGSFHPDSFFFSNEFHDGAEGHVFDPIQGGSDILIIDAAGMPISVIKETSFFQGALGPLQGDTTILIGNTLLNTVDIEHITAYNFPPLIIDDGDTGYNAPGFTNQAEGGQGFNGDIEFSPAGEGNTATWSFTNLPNGLYNVSATWDPGPDRASNSTFTIMDGADLIILEVDQQLAPDDFQDEDEFFEILGVVKASGTQLTVELSDQGANGFVIADAVRVERFNGGIILDNESETFNEIVEFTPPDIIINELSEGFLGSQLEVPGNASIMLTFSQALLDDIQAEMILRATDMLLISTTYAPKPDLSKEVKITLTLNGVDFEVTIDQTQLNQSFTTAPAGLTPIQNLFLCRVPKPAGSESPISGLRVRIESLDLGSPFSYDSMMATPVNKLELPQFGDLPFVPDFEAVLMCLVSPFLF